MFRIKILIIPHILDNVQGYKKAELDNYIQSKPQDKKDKKKGNKSKNEKSKEAPIEQKKVNFISCYLQVIRCTYKYDFFFKISS